MKRLLVLTLLLAALAGPAGDSQAASFAYYAYLDGPSEAVPTPSPGTGYAWTEYNDVLHTLLVHAEFQDLLGPVTASHIHAATAVPGVGTAGVATATPTFTGFPSGVTAGTYDHLFDTTLPATWNPSYITAHGGTPAGAEAAFVASLAAGTSYFNIHTQLYPGGEIRGFLHAVPDSPTLGLMAVGLLGLLATRQRARG
ncbi:MAG: CHRD domain-containing protein [Candidatus Eisenbacteria bacterium]|nr:CHRD domain-containing protein [Candidatus Eisenbacteria bacterium]